MKRIRYEILVPARGEIRRGHDVLTFDVEPGPADRLDPRIVVHLVSLGHARVARPKE